MVAKVNKVFGMPPSVFGLLTVENREVKKNKNDVQKNAEDCNPAKK